MSEGGKASETLRCLTVETEAEAGSEVVSEFEVEGKGEAVDVDVVMARVWAVADVDTFEGEEETANGFWNENGEEEVGMLSGLSWLQVWRCRDENSLYLDKRRGGLADT
jgi:hypothetical protein